jgi:hypothetical protein
MKLRVIANLELSYHLYSPSRNLFYTGKAGREWAGPKENAYSLSKAGAEYQRNVFNKPETGFAIKDWVVVPA